MVVAGDPMWRGGLSGPRSVYLHVDRPLITHDASSPLLHELMHSLMHARSGEAGEWIVEGIAEFYSIELLRRSKTLSEDRFEAAMTAMKKRAARSRAKLNGDMDGPARSKAVLALIEVDEAIREATNDEQNLDGVVRVLERADESVTLASLREAVKEVAGVDFPALFTRLESNVDRKKS
jgi:predicted metalloprotease with PDZ domain